MPPIHTQITVNTVNLKVFTTPILIVKAAGCERTFLFFTSRFTHNSLLIVIQNSFCFNVMPCAMWSHIREEVNICNVNILR